MRQSQGIEELLLYGSRATFHPFRIAAWMPTDWGIVDEAAVLTPLNTKRVLEIGAGSGRLVRRLLESGRVDAQGKIGGIELEPAFYRFMEKNIRDPRLTLVHGYAEDLTHHRDAIFGEGAKVDRVYASLPFSVMEKTRSQIFQAVREILSDDGEFIVYIFRDIADLLREAGFAEVEAWKSKHRQLLPPVRYTLHRARKNSLHPERNGHAKPLPGFQGLGADSNGFNGKLIH